MDVTKHIICELTGYRPGTVDVSQGDRGSRAVSCRLLENGAPWMIPEGATARVAYTLPDGTEGLYDRRPDGNPMWEIAGNTVTVELADQLMAQAGMVQMSILVIGPEGGQLATWPIRVMVIADSAARLTVPENLPPYGAGFAGKLVYGGADGTITPLGLGDGVRVETMANGAMVLVGEGGGPSEDILTELRALADRVNAALDSDDATLDQLSEIVAYIKSNKTLIDAITTSKVSVADIIDNLTTNAANKPLSAAQGVALAGRIEAVRQIADEIERELADKLAADELPAAIEDALAQAKENGEFDGPPGDDYVLTDADRQEIAEIAAGLVEVPDDSSKKWNTLLDVTLTEAVQEISLNTAAIADFNKYNLVLVSGSVNNQDDLTAPGMAVIDVLGSEALRDNIVGTPDKPERFGLFSLMFANSDSKVGTGTLSHITSSWNSRVLCIEKKDTVIRLRTWGSVYLTPGTRMKIKAI